MVCLTGYNRGEEEKWQRMSGQISNTTMSKAMDAPEVVNMLHRQVFTPAMVQAFAAQFRQ
jgi:hypothetical protein